MLMLKVKDQCLTFHAGAIHDAQNARQMLTGILNQQGTLNTKSFQ